MIDKISRLLILLGLLSLAAAGILLTIAGNPEETLLNYQAEVLGNFAYSLFWLGVLVQITYFLIMKTKKS